MTMNFDEFITDCCVVGDQHTERFAILRLEYSKWCAGKPGIPLGKGKFAKALTKRGFRSSRGYGVAIRLAIALKPKSPRVSPDTDPPTAVPDAAKTHHLDAFIAERCAVGERHIVRYAALWAAYLEWCAGNKVVPLTQRGFRTALNSRRIVAMSGTGNVAMRVGIALFPIQKVEDGGI